jgi:sugar O-acyltransferase (sialic acid O-acetyltransferase NeuD family)
MWLKRSKNFSITYKVSMGSLRIVIIGGGGHAKELIEIISSRSSYVIEGIIDEKFKAGEKILGIPVLGGDGLLEQYANSGNPISLALGVGAAKASDRRKMLYNRFKLLGFSFPAIVHNKAYVAKNVTLQDGVQIMSGAIVGPDTEIGENVVIYSGSIIGHDCKIASHAYLSPGTLLGGGVIVGEASFIGIGARVIQGVKIGNGVTVGAGAVVIKDVEDDKIVAGIPAKEI